MSEASYGELHEALQRVHQLLAFLEKAQRPEIERLPDGSITPVDFYKAVTWLHIQKQRLAIGKLLNRKDEPQGDELGLYAYEPPTISPLLKQALEP